MIRLLKLADKFKIDTSDFENSHVITEEKRETLACDLYEKMKMLNFE